MHKNPVIEEILLKARNPILKPNVDGVKDLVDIISKPKPVRRSSGPSEELQRQGVQLGFGSDNYNRNVVKSPIRDPLAPRQEARVKPKVSEKALRRRDIASAMGSAQALYVHRGSGKPEYVLKYKVKMGSPMTKVTVDTSGDKVVERRTVIEPKTAMFMTPISDKQARKVLSQMVTSQLRESGQKRSLARPDSKKYEWTQSQRMGAIKTLREQKKFGSIGVPAPTLKLPEDVYTRYVSLMSHATMNPKANNNIRKKVHDTVSRMMSEGTKVDKKTVSNITRDTVLDVIRSRPGKQNVDQNNEYAAEVISRKRVRNDYRR